MTTQLATALEAELKDEKANDEKRLAAAGELIDLRPEDLALASGMLDLIGPRVAPEFATKLLETAGRTHHGEFGEKLAGSIAGFTPGLRRTEFAC